MNSKTIGMKRIAPYVLSGGEEIIAAQAIVAPVKRVIESPGNTGAGKRLNRRNATRAPSRGKRRNSPSWAPVRSERAIREDALIGRTPAPCQLTPSRMFSALLQLVTRRGTTM